MNFSVVITRGDGSYEGVFVTKATALTVMLSTQPCGLYHIAVAAICVSDMKTTALGPVNTLNISLGMYTDQAQLGMGTRHNGVWGPGTTGYGDQAQLGMGTRHNWVWEPGTTGYGDQAQLGMGTRHNWVWEPGTTECGD